MRRDISKAYLKENKRIFIQSSITTLSVSKMKEDSGLIGTWEVGEFFIWNI